MQERTTSPPDIIYLQYYGDDWYIDDVENPEPVEGNEVTWCEDKINEVDIKYLLATPERETVDNIIALAKQVVRSASGLRGYEMNYPTSVFFRALSKLEEATKEPKE